MTKYTGVETKQSIVEITIELLEIVIKKFYDLFSSDKTEIYNIVCTYSRRDIIINVGTSKFTVRVENKTTYIGKLTTTFN